MKSKNLENFEKLVSNEYSEWLDKFLQYKNRNIMKTNELRNGKVFDFSNEENQLEVFFSKHLNKFCIIFNAKLFTSKNLNTLENELNRLKVKFNL